VGYVDPPNTPFISRKTRDADSPKDLVLPSASHRSETILGAESPKGKEVVKPTELVVAEDSDDEPPAKKSTVANEFPVYWDESLVKLSDFIETHGRYPVREDSDDRLFRWAMDQKYRYWNYQHKEPRKYEKLSRLPLWDKFINKESQPDQRERRWGMQYRSLENFIKTRGVWPNTTTRLGRWFCSKRNYYRKHPVSEATKWQLSELAKLPGWETYSPDLKFGHDEKSSTQM